MGVPPVAEGHINSPAERIRRLSAEVDARAAEALQSGQLPTLLPALVESLAQLAEAELSDVLVRIDVEWTTPTGHASELESGCVVRDFLTLSFRPGCAVYFHFQADIGAEQGNLLAQAIMHQFDVLQRRELEYALYADTPDLLLALDQARAQSQASREQVTTLEGRLLQSEKLAAIGQLAAGVAHEINNPIGYVGSNLNTLQEYVTNLLQLVQQLLARLDGGPGSREARAEVAQLTEAAELEFISTDLPVLLSESQEGIQRVRRTVQDLKDFSRTEPFQFDWADLHQGLEKTLNIVHYELKHRAHIVRNFGDLPPVFCSLNHLNQVFLNILLNAGQALEAQGEIQITTRVGNDSDDWVVVEITDNGPGMTDEVRARIFEPFFTTKSAGEGTGLGLPISLRIVEQHKGRIEIRSTPGVGTSFLVWLPIQPDFRSDSGDDHGQ